MSSITDSDDAEWQAAAYEQFLRDDSPDDALYEELKIPPCPTKNDKQIQGHSQPNITKRTSN